MCVGRLCSFSHLQSEQLGGYPWYGGESEYWEEEDDGLYDPYFWEEMARRMQGEGEDPLKPSARLPQNE